MGVVFFLAIDNDDIWCPGTIARDNVLDNACLLSCPSRPVGERFLKISYHLAVL